MARGAVRKVPNRRARPAQAIVVKPQVEIVSASWNIASPEVVTITLTGALDAVNEADVGDSFSLVEPDGTVHIATDANHPSALVWNVEFGGIPAPDADWAIYVTAPWAEGVLDTPALILGQSVLLQIVP